MSGIDKDDLYGDYRESAKKQQKLALKAAYKALDIPDEDVNINTSANRYGMSPAGVVGVALISSLLPVLAMWGFNSRPSAAVPSQPAIADSEYEVRFFDKDGKPITVPHIRTRPVEPEKK